MRKIAIGIGYLNVEVPTEALDDELARTRDFTPWVEAGIAHWRSIIASEFSREGWQSPGGGFRHWPKTQPFGPEETFFGGGGKTLEKYGTLRDAWLGRNSHSVTETGPNSGTFGVRGLIYAAVHRGGAGDVKAAQARRPLKIRVTEKMRGYLAKVKGVHLRQSTKFITIPRRPHATSSPELRTALIQLARRYVIEGRAQQRAAA